jgi:hypothetical protein
LRIFAQRQKSAHSKKKEDLHEELRKLIREQLKTNESALTDLLHMGVRVW